MVCGRMVRQWEEQSKAYFFFLFSDYLQIERNFSAKAHTVNTVVKNQILLSKSLNESKSGTTISGGAEGIKKKIKKIKKYPN